MARYKIPGADEVRSSSVNAASVSKVPSYSPSESSSYGGGLTYTPPQMPAIPNYSLITFDDTRRITTKPCKGNLLGSVYNLDKKTKLIAALLAWFVGWAQLHNFYLGYFKKAKRYFIVAALTVVFTVIMSTTQKTIFILPAVLGFAYLSLSVVWDFIRIVTDRMMKNNTNEKLFGGKKRKTVAGSAAGSSKPSSGGTRFADSPKGGKRYAEKR